MPIGFSFEELIEKLSERLMGNLPGAWAHDRMRAVPVGLFKPIFEHKQPPRPGSVLILLYPHEDRVFFPLTQRPQYLGTHSGQVSLPGGKSELGEDAITTAIRESEEEIGIVGSEVKVIGKLSDFFVIPSNFMVTPVIGFLKSKPNFVADPVEVEKIIYGSLEHLVSEEAIQTKEILAAGKYPLLAPHFEIEGQLVWGATAMMLNELREILKSL